MRFAKGLSPAFGPLDAYWQARYDFDIGGSWHRMLFVGVPWVPVHTPWPLNEHDFGIVSAYNPHSEPKRKDENEKRLRSLHRTLENEDFTFARSLASARDGTWPEPGFAILRIRRSRLLDLAREYEQAATVYVVAGQSGLLLTQTEQWLTRAATVTSIGASV